MCADVGGKKNSSFSVLIGWRVKRHPISNNLFLSHVYVYDSIRVNVKCSFQNPCSPKLKLNLLPTLDTWAVSGVRFWVVLDKFEAQGVVRWPQQCLNMSKWSRAHSWWHVSCQNYFCVCNYRKCREWNMHLKLFWKQKIVFDNSLSKTLEPLVHEL